MCQETTVERTVKSQTRMPNQWRPKAMCLEQRFASGIESTSEPADPVLRWVWWELKCVSNEWIYEWVNEAASVPTNLSHWGEGRVGFLPFELKGCWLGLAHRTGWCRAVARKLLRENLRMNRGSAVREGAFQVSVTTHGFSSSWRLLLGSVGVNEGLLRAKQYPGHCACNHGPSSLSKPSESSERDRLANGLFQQRFIPGFVGAA